MISWFARNDVAANLLLVFIVATGLYTITRVLPLEVTPTIDPEMININVIQRGGAPADIESAITIRIEEAIADYQDIEHINSTSSEGNASIRAMLYPGADKLKALNELKSRVDALSTLPTTAERPTISASETTFDVISLVVYGDLDEKELTSLTRELEDELLRTPEISQTSIEGIRNFEISINVSEDALREYGLNIRDVSNAIKSQSLDLSAGQVRTKSGDILLSSKSQAYNYQDYAALTIRNFADGSKLKLSDIATIEDGFEENKIITRFNGRRAALITVSRSGNENAIDIAESVKQFIAEKEPELPDTVRLGFWDDTSTEIKGRLSILLGSAVQGAILVMIMLTLFLRLTVALWVVIGIPVCFAGAMILMPSLGVTINTMSLFGFIIVLGVVVDDAIVTGENIYTHFERHGDGLRAAIEGTQEVAKPVIFGVLTTIAAFVPLTQMGAGHGAFVKAIALVVICCLIFSIIETKLILPAHLKHLKKQRQHTESHNPLLRALLGLQNKVSSGMQKFINDLYRPFLIKAVRNRYLTLISFICIMFISITLISAGFVRVSFFPVLDSDTARATITMAEGTPSEVTQNAITALDQSAAVLAEKYTDSESGDSNVKGILTTLGTIGSSNLSSSGSTNLGRVNVALFTGKEATFPVSTSDFVQEWRETSPQITGVESLSFRAELFRIGDPVNIQLTSSDNEALQRVIPKIEQKLATYDGVFDIGNSINDGKRELNITLKPEGRLLGFDLQSVTDQVRYAYFGDEAQRIQRSRDDVRVMVKYPLAERSEIADLEDLRITSNGDNSARFADIASVSWSRAPTSIKRVDQQRAVNITADIDKKTVNQSQLSNELDEFMSTLLADTPQITYSLEGENAETRESGQGLLFGLIFTLLAIYTLLAIPFKSYSQPLIVMSVIPFSITGAILGHFIMGASMSFFSLFGMLALLGILVNDSLVMVDWVNQRVAEGTSKHKAIIDAGGARFRPIFLTSITTFVGLLPILFDTTAPAQFLIPMAISLGFGILYATFITLIMVPCNYVILEDIKNIFNNKDEKTNTTYEPLSETLSNNL